MTLGAAATASPSRAGWLALGAAFVTFGMFWGGWAVAAIDVERFLAVSHGGFGLLLAGAIVAAAAVNAAGGTWAERIGTGRMLRAALAGWTGLLAISGAVPHRLGFAALFVVTVAAGGLVDVVMNVSAASVFASRPGRLMQFHGLFNAGAVAGALVTGVVLRAGGSWRAGWMTSAVAAAATTALAWRAEIPSPPAPAPAPAVRVGRRWGLSALHEMRDGRVLGLAFVFACGALLEGGIDTWGVLALRAQLAISALAGAGAYVVGQSLATGARLGLGRSAGALGGARGAAAGAAVATTGLVLEATVHQPVVAGAGLALAAVGVSCCWPLLLAHAVAGHDRQGTVVGRVAAAGYLGFVGGPPVIGWIAEVAGLPAALLVLAGVGVVVATSPLHAARVRVGSLSGPNGER